MATIGSWGGVVFAVSRRQIKTFDGMQWDTEANYATHQRHLKSELLEFVGTKAGSISFTVIFSEFLGSDPDAEIKKLDRAILSGKIDRLVLGRKSYGNYKWVATKASKKLERFDRKGRLLHAKVTVSMKEYNRR